MTLLSTEKFRHQAEPILAAKGIDVTDDTLFSTIAELTLEKDVREQFYKTPFPPLEDTGIGYASDYPDVSYTVRAGLANIRTINRLWLKFRDAKSVHKVLDFGSGSGRLLRFPDEFGKDIELHGCDVNPEAVEWANTSFQCDVHRLVGQHDIPFADGSLDLIYCWSIFTHFSEAEHKAWLDAMMSKLATGGILIVTFKTPDMFERIKTDAEYRIKSRAQHVDLEDMSKQAETGFAYFECYDKEKSDDHGINAVTFGQAYISHEYIRSHWSEHADVMHIGAAVENWQDIAVLKKR